jgi:hypothetical protein
MYMRAPLSFRDPRHHAVTPRDDVVSQESWGHSNCDVPLEDFLPNQLGEAAIQRVLRCWVMRPSPNSQILCLQNISMPHQPSKEMTLWLRVWLANLYRSKGREGSSELTAIC